MCGVLTWSQGSAGSTGAPGLKGDWVSDRSLISRLSSRLKGPRFEPWCLTLHSWASPCQYRLLEQVGIGVMLKGRSGLRHWGSNLQHFLVGSGTIITRPSCHIITGIWMHCKWARLLNSKQMGAFTDCVTFPGLLNDHHVYIESFSWGSYP